MFTNTPLLDREAKILDTVQSFTRNISADDCAEVLDELFFEWVGSDASSDTSRDYRSRVAFAYRQMKSLLCEINTNSSQEVAHD